MDENTGYEDIDGSHEEAETQRFSFRINKEMIPCKLMFLFFEGAFGALIPFLNLFYISSGLTPASMGLSNGIGNCCALIAGPLWGALIDSSKHKKIIGAFLFFASTSMELSKPWIIVAVAKVSTNITCHNMTNYSSTTIGSLHQNLDSNTSVCETHTQLINSSVIFYTIMALGCTASILFSGFGTFLEGVIVNVIYSRKKKVSYGEQKMFAPIGMAVGMAVAGVAIDHYHPQHVSKYAAAFYVYFCFTILSIPLLYILTKQARWEHGRKSNNQVPVWKNLCSVLKKCDNVVFFLSVFVSGFLFSIYFAFYPLFMVDTMNNPTKTIISLVGVCSTLSELFFYPFSSKIIKLCGGSIPSVFLGIFSYVPRLLLTSYCTEAWQMLPIQVFQGIGLSLSWTAIVEYAYTIFPKEVTTTALGLLINLHFSAASTITDIAGGQLYQRYGGVLLYRVGAGIAGFWCVVMMIYFGLRGMGKQGRGRKGYEVLVDDIASIQSVNSVD